MRAGDEAERKPWARQSRLSACVCLGRICYFSRIRRERHSLKGLECISYMLGIIETYKTRK